MWDYMIIQNIYFTILKKQCLAFNKKNREYNN